MGGECPVFTGFNSVIANGLVLLHVVSFRDQDGMLPGECFPVGPTERCAEVSWFHRG